MRDVREERGLGSEQKGDQIVHRDRACKGLDLIDILVEGTVTGQYDRMTPEAMCYKFDGPVFAVAPSRIRYRSVSGMLLDAPWKVVAEKS
jgi:hypothetical protein